MIYSNEDIAKKNDALDKKLDRLINKEVLESIEEYPVSRVAKMLGKGSDTVEGYIKSGKLRARKETVRRAGKKCVRYFCTLPDVVAFQEQSKARVYDLPNIETPEQIFRRTFNIPGG